MKLIKDNIYEHCGKKYQSCYLLMCGNHCTSCAFHDDNGGCDVDADECHILIGRFGYFKLYNEENKMIKREFIVKFKTHDENELVNAYNEEHAKVIAQYKRIQMGEFDISVKSVEEIKPYVINVGKFEISIIGNELTIKRDGEHFNTNNGSERIIFELVKHIQELEKQLKTHPNDKEFIEQILKGNRDRDTLLNYIANFRMCRGL